MAKFVFVAVLFLAAVVVSTAAPTEDVKEHMESGKGVRAPDAQEFEEGNIHLRFRRDTCDTYATLGDAPCSASCVATGKTSGTCQGGVCVCSTENIAD